jgi:hypothetical protein
MRVQQLGARSPEEIPVAGVSLHDLLGEAASMADVYEHFTAPSDRERLDEILHDGDQIRHFRTPPWTWSSMAGVAGFVVLRAGKAICWLVTRMN